MCPTFLPDPVAGIRPDGRRLGYVAASTTGRLSGLPRYARGAGLRRNKWNAVLWPDDNDLGSVATDSQRHSVLGPPHWGSAMGMRLGDE